MCSRTLLLNCFKISVCVDDLPLLDGLHSLFEAILAAETSNLVAIQ